MQRGNVLLKQGDFADAQADFESVVGRWQFFVDLRTPRLVLVTIRCIEQRSTSTIRYHRADGRGSSAGGEGLRRPRLCKNDRSSIDRSRGSLVAIHPLVV